MYVCFECFCFVFSCVSFFCAFLCRGSLFVLFCFVFLVVRAGDNNNVGMDLFFFFFFSCEEQTPQMPVFHEPTRCLL